MIYDLSGKWLFINLMELVYEEYKKNGFYDYWNSVKPFEVGVLAEIALVDTEIAEGIDAMRDLDYEHLAEEIADRVIRSMNLANRLGIDLEKAIIDKHMKNLKRPKKHGRKVI